MARQMYQVGDGVVFRIVKRSTHPGPRAEGVSPAPHGDDYVYEVDKYWSVSEVNADGTIELLTRRGKRHLVQVDNPRLRRAKWWEKLFYRSRFPTTETTATSAAPVR